MSLAEQRDQVREYTAAKGLVLVDVVEEAASGGVRDGEEFRWEHRPALLELMERAKAREFDALIVSRLDRLSRDHPTLIVLERRLLRFGVKVLSVAEENGDGPVAEFIRGQLALVAQLERAMIRTRVSAGKAKRRQEGRHLGGRAPFGYRICTTGRFEIDTGQAKVVRAIFRRAREGLGPGPIARRLNAEGTAGPSPKPWNRQTVTNIVRNSVYTGELHGVKKVDGKSPQPAIVSRRAWNQAQAAMPRRVSSEPSDEAVDARIADIEGRWDRLLDEYADVFKHPRFERREQNFRNAQAGKRARKGLPARGTVSEERRRFAEAELFRLVHGTSTLSSAGAAGSSPSSSACRSSGRRVWRPGRGSDSSATRRMVARGGLSGPLFSSPFRSPPPSP